MKSFGTTFLFPGILAGALALAGVMLYLGLERSAGIDASVERDWDRRAAEFLGRARHRAAAAWTAMENEALDRAERRLESRGLLSRPADLSGHLCFALDRNLSVIFPKPWPAAWTQVREILPGDAAAREVFANAEKLEFAEGNLEGALSVYSAILAGEHGASLRAAAALAAGGAAAKLGRHEEAARHLRVVAEDVKTLGIEPWMRAAAAYRLAREYEATGDAKAATKALTDLFDGLMDRDEHSRFAGIEAARREFYAEGVIEDLSRIGKTVNAYAAAISEISGKWIESRREDGIIEAIRLFIAPSLQFRKGEKGRSRVSVKLAGKTMIAVVEARGETRVGAFLDPEVAALAAVGAAAEPASPFELFPAFEGGPPAWKSRSMPLLDGENAVRLHVLLKDDEAPGREAANRKLGLGALLLFAGIGLFAGTVIVLRRLKREMDLSRLRADMLSSVSHDFRTPLTLIRSAAETLSLGRAPDPEKSRRYLDMIVKEVQRLDGMVGNVVEAVRLDMGRREYRFDLVAPAALFAEIEASRRLFLAEKGFLLEVEIEPGVREVKADAAALRSAMYNLIDNAVKFSSDRREIRLSAANASDRVLLSVEDRGPGIPAEERDRLFERFFRSRTVVEKIDGLGLGLALAMETARAHGGRIEYRDREGGGAAFVLSLPAAPDPG